MRPLNGSIACAACWVRPRTEWGVLNRTDVQYLEESRRQRIYRRHETLFHQGDDCLGLYCIETGHVLVSQMDSLGNDTIFAVLGPGQTTGYRSFFAKHPHAATARALTDCRICLIPAAAVHALLARSADLALRMLETLACDPGPRAAPVLRSPRLPVQTRVIHLLLLLKDQFAEDGLDGKVVYHLPMSRQDLAAMVGARPETVARAIRELHDSGLALFAGQRITVPAFRRLQDLAAFEHVCC